MESKKRGKIEEATDESDSSSSNNTGVTFNEAKVRALVQEMIDVDRAAKKEK